MPLPKQPDACEGLADIRAGIDHLDHRIIDMMAKRMAYVKAAVQFKLDEESIPAPSRVAAQLAERRRWAEQAGLPPDGVAMLFSGMINWFIQQQILHWHATRADARKVQ